MLICLSELGQSRQSAAADYFEGTQGWNLNVSECSWLEPPATSHPPGSDLNRNQERDFCTAKNKWGTFFYQDSFKEPPDFWGLQMLVSIKAQPPSEVGTTTFPAFAL